MKRTRSYEAGLLAVASLAVATSTPLAKAAAKASMPWALLASTRTGIAAAAIAVFTARPIAASLRAMSARDRLALVTAGALLALHFGLFLAGVAHTSLAAAAALIALEPLAVVAMAALVFGARPSLGEGVGIGLAVAGGAIVASGSGEGEHTLGGDLLIVAAVVVYAAYVAFARALRDRVASWPYAATVYAAASIALLPVAFATTTRPPEPMGWLAAVAMALVTTLVGHTLIQKLARESAPAVVALVSPGETVGAIAIGAALMDAWPSAREALGAAVVVGGTIVAVWKRRG